MSHTISCQVSAVTPLGLQPEPIVDSVVRVSNKGEESYSPRDISLGKYTSSEVNTCFNKQVTVLAGLHTLDIDSALDHLFHPDDFVFGQHVTKDSSTKAVLALPEFPICPKFPLLPDSDIADHACTVKRPQPSHYFINHFPKQAALYKAVIDTGLPNYLGAKLDLDHQINIEAWRAVQHRLEDKQLVDFLQYGFPVGYCSDRVPAVGLVNHSSARAHPEQVEKYLNTECDKEAMMGPMQGQPFVEWSRVNPMMTRPKRDSSDLRVILDLSFPDQFSVNAAIPKNSLEGSVFKMRLPNPDTLAAKIRELGEDCLLYKVDLSRAYRQLRSDPFDWALLGVQWEESHFIDTAIPFGLRHRASACQRTTQAVAHLTKILFDAFIAPYVDDSAGAALPGDADVHYDQLLELMITLGLAAAEAKCQRPLSTLTWIGVLFNAKTMTMSISVEKINETIDLCKEFLASITITHKKMQQLLGRIFYSIRCTEAARRFTNRLLDLLRITTVHNQVVITPEARLDVLWLIKFLPLFNGTTIMKPATAEKVCFIDACPKGGGGRATGFITSLSLSTLHALVST